MTSTYPKKWSKWLSLEEYWHNTNYHSAIHTIPYEAVCGQPLPIYSSYISGSMLVDSVDRSLVARAAAIHMLRHHLKQA